MSQITVHFCPSAPIVGAGEWRMMCFGWFLCAILVGGLIPESVAGHVGWPTGGWQQGDQVQDGQADQVEDDQVKGDKTKEDQEKNSLNKLQERPAAFLRPVIIELHGPITRSMLRYFQNRIAQARRHRADLIVLEISSPGGLLVESYEIAETLRDIDWAYTVAFSNSQALSGAALISFGCDEMILSPEMRLGDIGVIYHDPDLFAFRLVPAKIQTDVVTFGRTLAESKSRSPEIMESMIDKDVAVYTRVNETGIREFRNHRLDAPNPPEAPWEMIRESGPERFLEITGVRAVELGLSSANVGTREELANQLGVSSDDWMVMRYKTIDSVASFLSHPLITGMLVVIGFLALYLELSAPGIGVGAVVAATCALLFFWSGFMGGTAGILEVILFIAGIAFIAMELFVIPGWGISGMLGLFLLFSSVVMASQSFVIPETPNQWNQFLTTLAMLLCSGCIALLGAALITKKLGNIPVFNQMVLVPRIDKDANTTGEVLADGTRKPDNPVHPLVSLGDWGEAISPLRPAGRARFAGRSVDVVSDGDFINPGQPVKVVRLQGNIVTVTMAVDLTATQVRDQTPSS